MDSNVLSGQAGYRAALVAGAALVFLTFLTVLLQREISAAQTILAVFGGVLIAAPAIKSLRVSQKGSEAETVATAVSTIGDAIKAQDKAIAALAGDMDRLRKSLDETIEEAKNRALTMGHTDLHELLNQAGPKISNMGVSLSRTHELVQKEHEAVQKLSELAEKLREK